MIDPSCIDRIIDTLAFGTVEEVTQSLRDIQRQWAADLEAYEVLESRYRSTVEIIETWTAHAAEEISRIRKVREMRAS